MVRRTPITCELLWGLRALRPRQWITCFLQLLPFRMVAYCGLVAESSEANSRKSPSFPYFPVVYCWPGSENTETNAGRLLNSLCSLPKVQKDSACFFHSPIHSAIPPAWHLHRLGGLCHERKLSWLSAFKTWWGQQWLLVCKEWKILESMYLWCWQHTLDCVLPSTHTEHQPEWYKKRKYNRLQLWLTTHSDMEGYNIKDPERNTFYFFSFPFFFLIFKIFIILNF
jgi:hypothetical protein